MISSEPEMLHFTEGTDFTKKRSINRWNLYFHRLKAGFS